MADNPYAYFLDSKTAKQWKKIGIERRSGVLVPLFSIYSKDSMGLGEIPDLKLLADWCVKCSMSIIQLLPLNDTGFDFAPYSCQTTFALDPMYLRVTEITGIVPSQFEREISQIKGKCATGAKRVDYGVKKLKLKALWKMYESLEDDDPEFVKFKSYNRFWLDDYAIFKALKDKNSQKCWEDWEEKYKFKEETAITEFDSENYEEINFHKWLQWQIFLQFSEAKSYANSKGVFIQGDLPFLVARDSADVWAHQGYFNLNVSSGAPTDMYFAKGQRWGMPTYNWKLIEENRFDYLSEKVKYAGNFYDMFRIDHFVGLFRLWTIKNSEPADTYGLNGYFEPQDKNKWKEHGQKILKAMTDNTSMLPCAEDLGVVPDCSFETLKEFAIPGMDVQRWTRDWGKSYDFKPPENYRENSIAIIASHDMNPLIPWWENEASTVDAVLVEKLCSENNFSLDQVRYHLFDMARSTPLKLRWKNDVSTADEVLRRLARSREQAWMFYDMHRETYDEKQKFWSYIGMTGAPQDNAGKDFVLAALKTCLSTRSIFSIHIIQDWLSLGDYFDKRDKQEMRVNTPGTVGDRNWSITIPLALEELLKAPVNKTIRELNRGAGRI